MRDRGASRLSAVNGALGLIAVLVVVQMWLLTAALEADLAGHRGAALPAAITSAILLAACALLGLFVGRVDRASQADHGVVSTDTRPSR